MPEFIDGTAHPNDVPDKATLSLALSKLRTIEALRKSGQALGRMAIAHASDVPLSEVKAALEDLVESRIVRPEGEFFTIPLDDNDSQFNLVREVILNTIETLGPLPPKDLSECVMDVVGEDLMGPGKIQGVASAVVNARNTPLRRQQVGRGAASKWGRDFYYLVAQTDELGSRLRMYDNAKLRDQWRVRILGNRAKKFSKDGEEGAAGTEAAADGGAAADGSGAGGDPTLDLADQIAEAPLGEKEEERFPTFSDFLTHLRGLEQYQGQIIHIRKVAPLPAKTGELEGVQPQILESLKRDKKWPLYSHQLEAIRTALAGTNVVVATPNASGKSLCYMVPILDAALRDPATRALYITPTKALEQDQLKRFRAFASLLGAGHTAETYDGDTPQDRRKMIIARPPTVILTNPDELHYGILPFHENWAAFIRNLRYVVVDELHVYQGVFGSHVANILRRLRRVASLHGASPVFICASATIANPGDFAGRLCGVPFSVVDTSGSPQGPKSVVLWNPPMREDGRRASPYTEAVLLFKEHVKHRIRNITFAKSRRIAELVLRWAKQDFVMELAEKVASYRAGYRPEERRGIERGLMEGTLTGVTATNALELGVDIGGLDATILIGYPGTIASFWQQANRAGRGMNEALITLIALPDPLDQFLVTHPDQFFGKSPEHAVIDPENPYILRDHLPVAALEAPLVDADAAYFGATTGLLAKELVEENVLRPPGAPPPAEDPAAAAATAGRSGKRPGRRRLRALSAREGYTPVSQAPQRGVSIRTASRDSFQIVDVRRARDRVLGITDRFRAFEENHEGAIYLHQGNTYLVRELNLKARTAFVEPIEADYYTEPLRSTEIHIEGETKAREFGAVRAALGNVTVTVTVRGYVEIRESDGGGSSTLRKMGLDLPPAKLPTKALWVEFGGSIKEAVEEADHRFADCLHAVEHTAAALLPLYAICDRRDIGGDSEEKHPQVGSPVLFLYDNAPGGVGLVEKGFETVAPLLASVLRTIEDCRCDAGCPSCIHSPYCGKRNEGLDKQGAVLILRTVLEEIRRAGALPPAAATPTAGGAGKGGEKGGRGK